MNLRREEVQRKLLHILSGTLIPLGIFYLPMVPGMWPGTPAAILAVMLAVLLAVELARRRIPAVQQFFFGVAGTMLRAEEEQRLTGATWIFASSLLCALLFVSHREIASMVIAIFVLGDAVAALVGQSVGRVRINGKTLEGSAACLALCLALLLGVFPLVPGLLTDWGGAVPLGTGVLVALLTTVMELFPLRIGRNLTLNDNLTVPVVAGLAMWLLHP